MKYKSEFIDGKWMAIPNNPYDSRIVDGNSESYYLHMDFKRDNPPIPILNHNGEPITDSNALLPDELPEPEHRVVFGANWVKTIHELHHRFYNREVKYGIWLPAPSPEAKEEKSFTEQNLKDVMFAAMQGFFNWMKSDDCWIVDANTEEPIKGVKIAGTIPSDMIEKYVSPELEKAGFEYTPPPKA